MKALSITLIFSLFLLVSCSNDTDKTELQKEYELIKESQPKKPKVEKPASTVQLPKYKLGVDYEVLEKPYATDTTDKVVVYEFFSYSCSHCFYFEPFLNKWLETKPDYIKYERVPLNFQQGWDVLQQAYLTAKTMNIGDDAHNKLFAAIHNDHRRFNSIDELAKWYADNFDIDEKTFISTAGSFILDSQQRKADKMGFEMKVTGTPALVINGKYKISKKIRDRDEIIKVLKFLAKLEAKEMGLISE